MATIIKVENAPTAKPAQPKDGDELTLLAKVSRNGGEPKGALKAGFKHEDQVIGDVTDLSSVPINTAQEVRCTIAPFKSSDHSGTYTLWAKEGEADISLDDAVATTVEVPASNGPENGSDEGGRVELRELVWDPDFAGATGALAASLVVVIGIVCTVAASRFIGSSPTADDVASLVVVLGVFLGATMVIGGTWIVVLELRGRSPHRVTDSAPAVVTGKGISPDMIKEAIKALPETIKSISKLTGAIALIVVGAILVGAMAVLAENQADDQQPTRDPANTSSTTSTTTEG